MTEGMYYYTQYWKNTGAVWGAPYGHSGLSATLDGFKPDGSAWIAVDRPASLYTDMVVEGVLTKRPVGTLVRDGAKLSGLPVPCSIMIEEWFGTFDSKTYDCDDGVAEISLDVPGRYAIHVYGFPVQEVMFEVVVAADGSMLWSQVSAEQDGYVYENRA